MKKRKLVINLDEVEIIDLYVNKKLTILDIAQKFKVNHGTIRLRLIKAGVEIRSHSKNQKMVMNRPEVKENVSKGSKKASSKRIKTNIKRYNVAVPANNTEKKEKWKLNHKNQYGVEWPNQRKDVRRKYKRTCQVNYNVDNTSKLTEVKEKIKNNRWKNKSTEELKNIQKKTEITWLNNLDVINPLQSEQIKTKIRKTSMEKNLVDWPSKNPITIQKIKNSIYNNSKQKVIERLKLLELDLILPFQNVTDEVTIKCKKCNNIFYTVLDYVFHGYGRCPVCFPKMISEPEREIKDFVNQYFSNIILNDRKILNGKELDIVIPEIKVAIEHDGLYYHSDKHLKNNIYHLEKTLQCLKVGYKLIHIFEDEWFYKKDIVKNRLLHIFGKAKFNRIHARKCTIQEIDAKTKNEFLEKFHIQGKDSSTIKLGAFYEDQLISVMTFAKGNIAKGSTPEEGIWELNRFCSNYNYHIPGIVSKLLSYFKTNYIWKKLFSYADRRWSTGNLYLKIGFRLVKETTPNYWYVNGLKRIHRFSLRKKPNEPKNIPEWVLRQQEGYYRIWDCGNLKFEMV